MNFWNLMIWKDDLILSFANKIVKLKILLNPQLLNVQRKMRSLSPAGVGKSLYVILNAPSLETQDLSVLRGKITMFVNRGFLHPLYQELKPKYHVFIDSKMIKGIWPVTWIDEIWRISPDTKILLPLAWYLNPIFSSYRDKIYWLNWDLPFYNLGVSGSCFSFGIQQKFDIIYFTGFDATGIGYELIKAGKSHFYGNDMELVNKTTSQFAVDLLMHSRHLHDMIRLSDYCKAMNVKIVNLTNGGLLDMFHRENIIPLLKK